MNETRIMPAPEINLGPKTPSKFDREAAAFRRLLPHLRKDYGSKFVAIHGEQVVGSGDDLIQVALEAYQRFGYQPIYVDLVTEEAQGPVRIPHFHILSQ